VTGRLLLAFLAGGLSAQEIAEVQVVSEFANGPGGREILSPALVRNGWSRFRLMIRGPAATSFELDIAQNPEGAARTALFRDGKPVDLPVRSLIPASGTALFTVEFWINGDAPVRRIKLEPQVYTEASKWIVYPMEGRVVERAVPAVPARARFWREFFCGQKEVAEPADPVMLQDIRLAQVRPRGEAQQAFERALGMPLADWCGGKKTPGSGEWFLVFRDWLLK
jgi:hypothetical protein